MFREVISCDSENPQNKEKKSSILQLYTKKDENYHFCTMLCRFTSDVKIKSISVVGGADGTSPSKMRA